MMKAPVVIEPFLYQCRRLCASWNAIGYLNNIIQAEDCAKPDQKYQRL
ncbi:hypothetical protein BN1184_AY_00520 [Pantoea ananatis]|nr:hypothetical protein BN1184_AY_00520 [Pantoea ananatis]